MTNPCMKEEVLKQLLDNDKESKTRFDKFESIFVNKMDELNLSLRELFIRNNDLVHLEKDVDEIKKWKIVVEKEITVAKEEPMKRTMNLRDKVITSLTSSILGGIIVAVLIYFLKLNPIIITK